MKTKGMTILQEGEPQFEDTHNTILCRICKKRHVYDPAKPAGSIVLMKEVFKIGHHGCQIEMKMVRGCREDDAAAEKEKPVSGYGDSW